MQFRSTREIRWLWNSFEIPIEFNYHLLPCQNSDQIHFNSMLWYLPTRIPLTKVASFANVFLKSQIH